MAKDLLSKFMSKELLEGPIEAGQTLGLNAETVLQKYLGNRNAILSLLRIYSNYSIPDLAQKLDMSGEELEKIEKSNELAPYRLVPKYAEIFNVNLKALLILLGLTKGKEERDTDKYFNELPLAARYSGPELTKQEKVDLEELFRIIIHHFQDKKKKAKVKDK